MLQNAVLITGAGQRIGLYLAEAFLRQTPYPVVFTYRTFRPSVQALLDQGALGIQVDFNDPQARQQFLQWLPQQVGSLRGIIHNASVWAKEVQLAQTPSHFAEMMAVHVTAPYEINLACQHLLNLSTQPHKDIIHITDTKLNQGDAQQIAYLASKSAMHSMTLSFAKAFAPTIKVNEIQPGLVIFNEEDSPEYRANRLAEMTIPIEPGAEVVWQMVQTIFNLPNTTGISFPLASE